MKRVTWVVGENHKVVEAEWTAPAKSQRQGWNDGLMESNAVLEACNVVLGKAEW